jgi:hypothetical protein
MTVFIGWLLHPFFHILVLAPQRWADLIPSTQRQGTICIIVADSNCFHGVRIFNTLQYDMY